MPACKVEESETLNARAFTDEQAKITHAVWLPAGSLRNAATDHHTTAGPQIGDRGFQRETTDIVKEDVHSVRTRPA
jgi:hypothetical protein